MIASLRGQVLEIQKETLTLEVNNIGYEVYASTNMLSEIVEGIELRLLIFTHVREDQFSLFGFLNTLDKNLFLSLIKVNGIGPKVALNILSASTSDKLIEMIETSNAKALSKLPRIGKKKAEQIILSLKGKLVSAEESKMPVNKNKAEITWALVNLGFKSVDVDKVVLDFASDITIDDGVRVGLKQLSGTI